MNPILILFILCLLVVLSEILVERTILKSLGTALLVIVLTAIVANLGIIPAGSSEEHPVPVYDGIFTYLAPMSIFWLLLRVNLKDILKAGLPMIALFLIGAAGTTVGVILGMKLINGREILGDLYSAVGGMYTATYTGGSVNFNAVALHYDVIRDGVMYGGAVAVDNIITTLWMAATLVLPKFLVRIWKVQVREDLPGKGEFVDNGDQESMGPIDLGITLGMGFGALVLSDYVQDLLSVPSVITLTLIALIIAQVPWASKLRGPQALGLFSVYLFLAVIGAFCNLEAFGKLGSLGFSLLALTAVTVLVHALFTIIGGRLLRLDPDMVAITSQANIGGATSALALARSLGRSDLTLTAVLLGSLGTAIGTFLGFWVVGWLS